MLVLRLAFGPVVSDARTQAWPQQLVRPPRSRPRGGLSGRTPVSSMAFVRGRRWLPAPGLKPPAPWVDTKGQVPEGSNAGCGGMGYDHGRRQERVRVEGTLRLLVKSGVGFLVGSGEIVDLSVGGCAIRVRNRAIEANLTGRIEVAIAGESLSLPIVTRWVRPERDGWIVGCRFDDLTVENRQAVHALIAATCAIVI
jgi:PilZ domain